MIAFKPARDRRRFSRAAWALVVVGCLVMACAGVVGIAMTIYRSTGMPLAWALVAAIGLDLMFVFVAWRVGRVPRP